MDPRIKRMKNGANRKILLMVTSSTDSPWSSVRYCKAIEVRGAEAASSIRIDVVNEKKETMTYIHKGDGFKAVNVPFGLLRIKRLRGTEPITVYAHCGP